MEGERVDNCVSCPASNAPLGQRCNYNGWYVCGLNVAVGPTLGQRLKVSANLG